jgi:plastocyanin
MAKFLVVFVSVFAFALLPFLASGQDATPSPEEAAPCLPAETMTATAASPDPSGSPAATPAATPTAEASCTVAIVDDAFEEKTIKVAPGTTVIWTNESTDPSSEHTVTADDGSFDSGSDFEEPEKFLTPGESYMFTFETVGEFPYHCAIHGGPGGAGMSGTVIVE